MHIQNVGVKRADIGREMFLFAAMKHVSSHGGLGEHVNVWKRRSLGWGSPSCRVGWCFTRAIDTIQILPLRGPPSNLDNLEIQ